MASFHRYFEVFLEVLRKKSLFALLRAKNKKIHEKIFDTFSTGNLCRATLKNIPPYFSSDTLIENPLLSKTYLCLSLNFKVETKIFSDKSYHNGDF